MLLQLPDLNPNTHHFLCIVHTTIQQRAGQEKTKSCCVYDRDQAHAFPLESQLYPHRTFITDHGCKSISIFDLVQRKRSLQEQIRLQTSFLSMPADRQADRQDSQVVLCSSVLLTSFPPAVEGKEGREKPSLPPLSCQGACASKRSSSASSSSNPNTLAVRTEDGGRGREGIQRSDRGGRGGGEEQTNGRRRGGDGRGRLGDKPLRFLERRRCWWAALEMRDSYGAVMTQERGRRVGGSVSIGSRSPVGVNVRRGTSTKVPPSAHSSSSSLISARSLQLHTCEKLHC